MTWNSDGQDAGNDGVYGQYFAGNGMPSGDEFKVNRVPLESHSLSSSIGQDDGSFLVFWTSYDSEGGTPQAFTGSVMSIQQDSYLVMITACKPKTGCFTGLL